MANINIASLRINSHVLVNYFAKSIFNSVQWNQNREFVEM